MFKLRNLHSSTLLSQLKKSIYQLYTLSICILIVPKTAFLLTDCRDEKDNQGENMFMRCVSELVIESREVRRGSN